MKEAKADKIFESVGEVDSELVDEAHKVKLKKRNRILKRISIAAASLAGIFVVGVSTIVIGILLGGANDGGEGHKPLKGYMSYDGPILPLSADIGSGAEEDISALRELAMDIRRVDDSSGLTGTRMYISDLYTLENTSSSDRKLTLYYPFVGRISELNSTGIPEMYINGAKISPSLHAGSYAGGYEGVWGSNAGGTYNLDNPSDYSDYEKVLSDGSYRKNALAGYTLLDTPVTVYEVTSLVYNGDEEDVHPRLAFEMTIDPKSTTVLTYGFNGGGIDYETGKRYCSVSVPTGRPEDDYPMIMAVMGEDVAYELKGYTNGSLKTELDGIEAEIDKYETTLGELILSLSGRYVSENRYISAEMFAGIVCEMFTVNGAADRYAYSFDSIFSDTNSVSRVFYLAYEVTIPAGESITVKAEYTKKGSFNYTSKAQDKGIFGFDLAPYLDTVFDFTAVTATLTGYEGYEIAAQNFGFSETVSSVTLDPGIEWYYIEFKKAEE